MIYIEDIGGDFNSDFNNDFLTEDAPVLAIPRTYSNQNEI